MSTTPLAAIRQLFPKYNIGHYVVLTQDAHDSEYVAEADQRRAFITGFSGSAGHACIGLDGAELATDGRYFLQAEEQLHPEFTLRKAGTPGTQDWVLALVGRANADGRNIGVDPRFISAGLAARIQSQLKTSKLVGITENLVDAVWPNKPAEPKGKVVKALYAGASTESKLELVRAEMRKEGAEALVVFALDDVAWLFNLRGSDIAYNPVFKSYALVTLKSATLYVDNGKVEDLDLEYPHKPYDAIWGDLETTENVWVPAGCSWAVEQRVASPASKAQSPIKLLKVVKNEVEIKGAKKAQVQCGRSVTQLLAWIERTIDEGITEYQAAQKLLELRQPLEEFRGNSFPTISSVGPNAAIIHYEPAEHSPKLSRQEVYLCDSGCQFAYGTTDTTRTHHFGTPNPAEIEAYTLVLKGHIALALSVFPQGTTGQQLDSFARQHLWRYGLDYRHGTGHGVGSYLNVHEPPVGFGTALWAKEPLQAGNLISNEPGYYEDGKFGIRIENLVVVKEATTKYQFGGKSYLDLETITVVPLCLRLIDVGLLSSEERAWVNGYSAKVWQALEGDLGAEDREWLRRETREI